MLALGENVGGANVRGEHALLDDAVCVVALDLLDARKTPLPVEDKLGLDRLEIDRAALLPRLKQRSEESVQQVQARQQSFQLLRRLAPRVAERRGHSGIGEPRARAHDRRIEAIRADLALRADRHVAGHAQAVDFGVERAQAVGELLRQHRDDAAGKVNRVAALARLQVEGVAVAHVVAHVRDRDDEPKPFARLFAIHGVVEIPRRFAVDRHELERSQILAAAKVPRARHGRKLRRERLGLRRELKRQFVFPERDLDLDSGIGGFSQHLDDAADRLGVAIRLHGQFGDDDLTDPRIADIFRRDKDGLADTPLGGLNEEEAALPVQASHHSGVDALDDLDDRSFLAAAPVHA